VDPQGGEGKATVFLTLPIEPGATMQKNGQAPTQATAAVGRPDPEVIQRAPRRSFTATDKLRILAEADTCKQPGQLGALLRRVSWR
jgi:transposase